MRIVLLYLFFVSLSGITDCKCQNTIKEMENNNIVRAVINNKEEFLSNINNYAERLKDDKLFSEINLDYSEESIYKMDNALVANFVEGKIGAEHIKKVTKGILAYIGLVYIKKNGGIIEISDSKDEFRVYIIRDNEKIDFFTTTVETLLHPEEDELPNIGNGYFSITRNPFKSSK